MKHKKITWEYIHYDFDQQQDKPVGNEEFVDDLPESESLQNELDEFDKLFGIPQPVKKFMNTPFGLIDIDDNLNPFRRVEFRMGYTNFNISNDVAEKINKAEGVEILKIVSRYTFIIGIGKMFSFTEVRNNIESALGCVPLEIKKIPDNIESIKRDFEQKYSKWAIYMFPNGSVETAKLDSSEEKYEEDLKRLIEHKSISDGLLIQSE